MTPACACRTCLRRPRNRQAQKGGERGHRRMLTFLCDEDYVVRGSAGALVASDDQAAETWPDAEAQTRPRPSPERCLRVSLLTSPSVFLTVSPDLSMSLLPQGSRAGRTPSKSLA